MGELGKTAEVRSPLTGPLGPDDVGNNGAPARLVLKKKDWSSEVSPFRVLPSIFPSMEILDLLRAPEGKTLEFKRDLSGRKGIVRTLVAFANTSGGTLVLGVEDATRAIKGVTDPLDVEERLANLISDAIAPRLVPEIDIVAWRDLQLVVMEVHPSPARPHFARSEGNERGVYVRVGSSNRKAGPELVQELRRKALGQSFDELPLPDLGSEAIDFRAASESFSPIRPLKRPDLETLRLVTEHQGQIVPTVGGMLLFGHDREVHFPDAWIQAGRFAGRNRTRIRDGVEIRAYPAQAIEAVIAFVEKHSLRETEIGPIRRQNRWSLPPVAVREAVINAVVHADYSLRGAPVRVSIFDDRLEVENPGLLPFGLTLADLGRGISRIRNRVMGRVFKELGLIEQWGSGIQRMTSACREAGLPEPQFEEVSFHFRLTLSMERERPPTLEAIDQRILDALQGGTGLSTREISARINRSPRATRTRLAGLVDRGLLREVGTSPQDPRRKYYRTD